jgi:hypothetical protein
MAAVTKNVVAVSIWQLIGVTVGTVPMVLYGTFTLGGMHCENGTCGDYG